MEHDHISFIDHNMDQLILPLDLEINIHQNHLSRVVHEAVERIDDGTARLMLESKDYLFFKSVHTNYDLCLKGE
ncbi:MAG: hypothetical protein ACO1OC_13585 [Tuberibacillus sp.]